MYDPRPKWEQDQANQQSQPAVAEPAEPAPAEALPIPPLPDVIDEPLLQAMILENMRLMQEIKRRTNTDLAHGPMHPMLLKGGIDVDALAGLLMLKGIITKEEYQYSVYSRLKEYLAEWLQGLENASLSGQSQVQQARIPPPVPASSSDMEAMIREMKKQADRAARNGNKGG